MSEKIMNAVIEALRKYPSSRDSDFKLNFLTLKELGFNIEIKDGVLKMDLSRYKEFPSFETITRCRRKVQYNDNLYRASKEVEDRRKNKQEEFRREYSPTGFF